MNSIMKNDESNAPHQFAHQMKAGLSVLHMVLGLEKKDPQMTEFALTVLKDMDDQLNRLKQCAQLETRNEADFGPQQTLNLHPWLTHLMRMSRIEPHRIVLNCPQDCAPLLTWPALLQLPLLNLLDNAWRHGHPEAPIEVTVRQMLEGPDTLTFFEVQNQSISHTEPKPDPSWIFEKYYRAPEALRREGMGLGLYLAKLACAPLGASIDVNIECDSIKFTLITKT